MRLRFWRREPTGRQRALNAIAELRRHPLIKPATPPTTGSVNDDYWATQAWLGGYGYP
jgi:hypothetical protein